MHTTLDRPQRCLWDLLIVTCVFSFHFDQVA
jgi:hypothetical protein